METNDIYCILDRVLKLEEQSAIHRSNLLDDYSSILKRTESMIEKSDGRVEDCHTIVSNLSHVLSDQNAMESRLIELIECKERRIKFVEDQYVNLMTMYKDLLNQYQELAKAKRCENEIHVQK